MDVVKTMQKIEEGFESSINSFIDKSEMEGTITEDEGIKATLYLAYLRLSKKLLRTYHAGRSGESEEAQKLEPELAGLDLENPEALFDLWDENYRQLAVAQSLKRVKTAQTYRYEFPLKYLFLN